MSKNILKGENGLYFVLGQGFTASCPGAASVLDCSQIKCAAGLGYNGTKEELAENKSFAVTYIRAKDLSTGSLVKAGLNAAMNEVDPSKRRFATFDEAVRHGSRFNVRKANRGDQPGTAGHRGFYVSETSDPVNAKINWKTGLTNPVK